MEVCSIGNHVNGSTTQSERNKKTEEFGGDVGFSRKLSDFKVFVGYSSRDSHSVFGPGA